MDHLNDLFEALCEIAAESIVAGFDDSKRKHQASRDDGEDLRDRAAALALLGPKLDRVAVAILDEAVRRTVPRYRAYLNHPRYSSDPLIEELSDAEVTLNKLLVEKRRIGDAHHSLLLAIAVVRVRAITIALRPDCVAQPPNNKKRGGAPAMRRREVTAADIPEEVAQVLLGATDGEKHWQEALSRLSELRGTVLDRAGIVTKLSALGELEEGPAYFNQIITRLRSARFTAKAEREDIAAPTAGAPIAAAAAFVTPRLKELPLSVRDARGSHAEAASIGATNLPKPASSEIDRTHDTSRSSSGRATRLTEKFAKRSRSRSDPLARIAEAHARQTERDR